MKIYLRRLWLKWRYYSYEPDAVISCFPQIRLHNLRILRTSSLITVIFLAVFIFIPLLIKKNYWEVLDFAVTIAIQYGIFYYAQHQRKKPYSDRNCFFAVYYIFFFSLLLFGVHIEYSAFSLIPSINVYMFLL